MKTQFLFVINFHSYLVRCFTFDFKLNNEPLKKLAEVGIFKTQRVSRRRRDPIKPIITLSASNMVSRVKESLRSKRRSDLKKKIENLVEEYENLYPWLEK